MKITDSIRINNSPEVVFKWLSRPEKAMVWMKSVSKTEIIRETENMVGTTFRETVEENGQTMDMIGRITDYVPDRCIAFHIESKVNALDVEYRVEQIPEGARLEVNSNVRWKFPVNLISLIMGNKIRKNIVNQSRSEFIKLKEICEQER